MGEIKSPTWHASRKGRVGPRQDVVEPKSRVQHGCRCAEKLGSVPHRGQINSCVRVSSCHGIVAGWKGRDLHATCAKAHAEVGKAK